MSFPQNPDSLDSYGGVKKDYIGLVDPTYDRGADEVNGAFNAIAEMSNMALKAQLTFTGGSGPSIVPSSHIALWGGSLAVIPVIAVTGTGVLTITFPTTFTDELGIVQTINILRGWGQLRGAAGDVSVTPTSPNVVTVNLYNTSGSPNNQAGVVIDIWVS